MFYDICGECGQINTGYEWCQPCSSKHFQQEFATWSSGNDEIDKFIQETQLNARELEEVIEWIPFKRLNDVEYLATGGFGTVYSAKWSDMPILRWNAENKNWNRGHVGDVCLKRINNSSNPGRFLKEIKNQQKFNAEVSVIRVLGITKSPDNPDYMIVMEFASKGSLRKYLDKEYYKLSWYNKIETLWNISLGLRNIHDIKMIHKDFHSGNILVGENTLIDKNALVDHYISDFGLSEQIDGDLSVDETKKRVLGVLPYIAPEVLEGEVYTQASEIYSFGIIMSEVLYGLPPYHDVPHDVDLAFNICQGLRPKIRCNTPSLILNLMKRCWSAEPENRPTAFELHDTLYEWWKCLYKNHKEYNESSEIFRQIREIEESDRKRLTCSAKLEPLKYVTHPQAIYTSRLFDFSNTLKSNNSGPIETNQINIKIPNAKN